MNNILNIFVTINQDGSFYGSSKYINSEGVMTTKELSQDEIVALKDIVEVENSK